MLEFIKSDDNKNIEIEQYGKTEQEAKEQMESSSKIYEEQIKDLEADLKENPITTEKPKGEKTKATKKTIPKVKLTEEQKQSNIDKATAEQRAEAIKQTEQEYGSTTDKGVPTGETTGVSRDVSSEPASKIESIKSATTEQYTHTDAGFRDESDARDAYEQRGDKDVNQTYEEFLFSKACGDF